MRDAISVELVILPEVGTDILAYFSDSFIRKILVCELKYKLVSNGVNILLDFHEINLKLFELVRKRFFFHLDILLYSP